MYDTMRMEIVKSVHQLLSDFADLVLWQVPVVLQDLEELTLRELGDHAEFVGCLERVQQQDDVLVVEAFQNVDFLPQIVELLLCFASLGDELKSDDLPAALSAPLVDLSEGAFSNWMQHVVLIHF